MISCTVTILTNVWQHEIIKTVVNKSEYQNLVISSIKMFILMLKCSKCCAGNCGFSKGRNKYIIIENPYLRCYGLYWPGTQRNLKPKVDMSVFWSIDQNIC